MKEIFSERLSELLMEKNMTQKQLAEKAGITEAAVSHYLRGDRKPRSPVLLRIANALDTTPEYLSGRSTENPEEDIAQAGRLIARNVHQMTREQKLEIISILLSDE